MNGVRREIKAEWYDAFVYDFSPCPVEKMASSLFSFGRAVRFPIEEFLWQVLYGAYEKYED
jgi:hypothetical protein